MKTASNGSLPLYSQIVQDIRNKILNGTYKYNERLPNEKWLCNLYDISRTTLRKSIDELIAEGLLERHSNKGVYVVYSKFDTGFDRPYSLFQEMVKSGIKPSSKILSFSRINADSKLSRALNCEVNTPLLEILRLRYADDVPFNIQQLYLIESFFPQFNPWLLTDHSLYEIMESDYQIKIVKTVQVVTTGSVSKNQYHLFIHRRYCGIPAERHTDQCNSLFIQSAKTIIRRIHQKHRISVHDMAPVRCYLICQSILLSMVSSVFWAACGKHPYRRPPRLLKQSVSKTSRFAMLGGSCPLR